MPIQRKVIIPGTVTTAADVLKFIEASYDVEFLARVREAAFRRVKGELTDIRRYKFNVGDKIMYHSKRNGTQYGEIVEVMRANAKVKVAPDGKMWKVPLTMLQRNML